MILRAKKLAPGIPDGRLDCITRNVTPTNIIMKSSQSSTEGDKDQVRVNKSQTRKARD